MCGNDMYDGTNMIREILLLVDLEFNLISEMEAALLPNHILQYKGSTACKLGRSQGCWRGKNELRPHTSFLLDRKCLNPFIQLPYGSQHDGVKIPVRDTWLVLILPICIGKNIIQHNY